MPNGYSAQAAAAHIQKCREIIADRCKLECDAQPLKYFDEHMILFETVQKELGTEFHDDAVKKLTKAIEKTFDQAGSWWSRPWARAEEHRAAVRKMQQTEAATKAQFASMLATAEAMRPRDSSPQELIDLHNEYIATVKNSSVIVVSEVLQAAAEPLLALDMKVFWMHLRFYWGKLAALIIQHSLVLIIPILLIGLALSKAASWASASIEGYANVGYLAVFLIVAYLVFKKYVIDPAVNRLLKKLEAKRLKMLAFRWVSIVGMQALFIPVGEPGEVQANPHQVSTSEKA